MAARGLRLMGPDGLLEEELLKGATCDAALATEMRITFAGLPFEKMRGIGAQTYETYKAKYGKEPTSYALYAAESARIAIDAIKRAAADIEKGENPTAKREAVRKAIAGLKNYEGSTASGASTRTATPRRDHVGLQGREERRSPAASSSSSPSSNRRLAREGRPTPALPS